MNIELLDVNKTVIRVGKITKKNKMVWESGNSFVRLIRRVITLGINSYLQRISRMV